MMDANGVPTINANNVQDMNSVEAMRTQILVLQQMLKQMEAYDNRRNGILFKLYGLRCQ